MTPVGHALASVTGWNIGTQPVGVKRLKVVGVGGPRVGTIRKASGCRGRFRFRSRDFGCVLRRPFACDAEAARGRFAVAQRAVDGRVARVVRDRPVRRVNPLQRECCSRAWRPRPRVLVSGARREGRNSVRGLGGERVGGLLPAATFFLRGGQEAIPLAEPLANASDGTGGTAGSAEGNGAAVSLARVRDGGGAPRRRAGADVSAGAPAAGRAGQIDSNGPDIGRAGTRHRRDHEAIADVHDSSVNRIEGRPASLGCSTSAAETLRPGTVLRDERSGVDLSAEERAASPRRCSRSGFASRAGSSRIAGYRVLAGPRPGSCRSPWSHPRRWRPHLPIRI